LFFRSVSYTEGEAAAKEGNFIFQEVSAKTSANINTLFCDIFAKISKKFNLVGSENVEGIEGNDEGKFINIEFFMWNKII
jgi:hypothetical protein